MFKKNKSKNENQNGGFDSFGFDDVDAKLQKESESGSKKRSWVSTLGAVMGLGVVLVGGYAVLTMKDDSPPVDVPKPVVEEQQGFDTPVPTEEEAVPESEVVTVKDNKESKEDTAFKDSLPSDFSVYKNGYIDIKFGYSSAWVLEEKTQNSLELISSNSKDEVMELKNAKYPALLEIASLKVDGASLFIGVVPTKFSKVGTWQDGFIESNKEKLKSGKTSDLKSPSGVFKVQEVSYTLFDEARKGKQYQYKLKDGVLTVQLLATDVDKYEQLVRDTDALVESMTFK